MGGGGPGSSTCCSFGARIVLGQRDVVFQLKPTSSCWSEVRYPEEYAVGRPWIVSLGLFPSSAAGARGFEVHRPLLRALPLTVSAEVSLGGSGRS